jgi:hypothetical protein
MPQPRIEEITAFLAETRAELLGSVAGLTQDEMNHQPPKGWSIAQVLQHVALVESDITRFLGRRLQRAIEGGLKRDTETASVIHSLDPEWLNRPMQAPETMEPAPGSDGPTALAALRESRAKLNAFIETVDDWDGTQVTARHMALGVLNLYQWLVLVGHHDRRHMAQIQRLRGA